MTTADTFNYGVLSAWHADYYKGLLGKEMIQDLITVKIDEVKQDFVFIQNGLFRYFLPIEHLDELPILPTGTRRLAYRGKPHEIITSFKSARFKPVKGMEFRQLVDDLCCFEHEAPRDYTLWKILALSSLIGRTAYRVCSPPAFGKDSVMKVLGYLTGDVCVIANPTVAKLEYRLTNKVILLNEFANLKADDKYGMEHFLQSVGDMSNTYEKRSRAGSGTTESFDIGDLSVICAYNDMSCYTEDDKYFDKVFSQQTRERFIPFKFHGKIAQQIPNVANPEAVAKENGEYLQSFMRTITYYRVAWREERDEKAFHAPMAVDYGLTSRWATNFDRIREFIILYSHDAEEATLLLNALYNRHIEYLEQFDNGGQGTLFKNYGQKQKEEMIVTEDSI
jgi:hypothetical protein